MQLTAHFALEEFALDGPIPPECVPTFVSLCNDLLEPLRIHYNVPIVITSGYRTPTSNLTAHGVVNSQHVATAIYCAADFYVEGMHTNMRPVFDMIRGSSALAYDQLILEHGSGGDIIHASWSLSFNRREALEGATANASAYQSWPTVPAAPEIANG